MLCMIRDERAISVPQASRQVMCVPEACQLVAARQTLEELHVGWNRLTGEDASMFLRGITNNKTLHILKCQWNRCLHACVPALRACACVHNLRIVCVCVCDRL